MKQLINELNDYLEAYADATCGQNDHSIDVIPRLYRDIISQTTVECVINFCRKHNLHFFVDLNEKNIHIFKPTSNSLSND